MSRPRKPASLKAGKSESKAQLKRREEIEVQLMGNKDNVKFVPEYLTSEEQIYYRWLTEEIDISGIITNLDKPLLEQTANCLYLMRKCDDLIRENGLLLDKYDKFGNLEQKENPAIKIKLNLQTKYSNFCNQLGLSPSARAALAGKKADAKEENEDKLLQILRG